jgi:metal-sulfur cluster biosynthetic enzyme
VIGDVVILDVVEHQCNMTDAACVHYARIQSYIRDALSEFTEIHTVKICKTLEMLWTPDRVSESTA